MKEAKSWTTAELTMLGSALAIFAALILDFAGVWAWVALQIHLWA